MDMIYIKVLDGGYITVMNNQSSFNYISCIV